MYLFLLTTKAGAATTTRFLLSPAGIAQMLRPGPRQARGVFARAGYGMAWFTGRKGSYRPGRRAARQQPRVGRPPPGAVAGNRDLALICADKQPCALAAPVQAGQQTPRDQAAQRCIRA